jgi:hypothetical protein
MKVTRSWVEWAVDNAPLPDRRSKLILASTVAAVALVVVGAAAVMTAPKKSHPAAHNPPVSFQLPPSVSTVPTTLPTGATSAPSKALPTGTTPRF